MNRKSILVIDDNVILSNQIAEKIRIEKEYIVAGVAHNGKDGLEIIKEKKPDIIILDMIMPYLDGIGVLDLIYDLYDEDKKTPIIIAATAIGKDIALEKLRGYELNSFIQKPFRLDELMDAIKRSSKLSIVYEDLESIAYKVGFIVREIGIVSNLRGYNFLIDAVEYMVCHMDQHVNFCTEIYIPIGKKYDTSSANVEKSISRLIDNSLEKEKFKDFNKVYKNKMKKNKPTNKEFVKILAEIVASTL